MPTMTGASVSAMRREMDADMVASARSGAARRIRLVAASALGSGSAEGAQPPTAILSTRRLAWSSLSVDIYLSICQSSRRLVRCFESRPLGMAGEGERPEAPPSWSSMANKQPQKATAAAAILGWLLSLAAARGVQVPVDPGVLLRIDRGTLVRVLEAAVVTLSRPVVSGAAALMELLSRAVLLLLAVILCATPSKREVVLQRVRALLKEQVEVAVRSLLPPPCSAATAGRSRSPSSAHRSLSRSPHGPAARQTPLAPAPAAIAARPAQPRRPRSSRRHRLSLRMSPAPAPPQPLPELPRCGGLPNVLVVGAGGVGKSTLIGWLNARAAESRLELAAAEGMPSGRALEAYAKVDAASA